MRSPVMKKPERTKNTSTPTKPPARPDTPAWNRTTRRIETPRRPSRSDLNAGASTDMAGSLRAGPTEGYRDTLSVGYQVPNAFRLIAKPLRIRGRRVEDRAGLERLELAVGRRGLRSAEKRLHLRRAQGAKGAHHIQGLAQHLHA